MVPRSTSAFTPAVWLAVFWVAGGVLTNEGYAQATESVRLNFDAGDSPETSRPLRVRFSDGTPGNVTSEPKSQNNGSWSFDGQTSIVYSVPSSTEGFESDFTWEGFFFAPAANQFLAETGIADRLVTQFAFDRGDWTRLAIGLVAATQGPRLSVELEGFEGRTFGLGDVPVTLDEWHHFALVHEGTAAAGVIRWYLDYHQCGEIFLGGQANQNTLRPPGDAPFTIGARLRTGRAVNRGFQGLIDEIRLTPRPLSSEEFLRTDSAQTPPEQQPSLAPWARFDWAARHVWAERESQMWRRNIGPKSVDSYFARSELPIEDAAFLRRVSLVVRGRIPSLGEAREFLADRSPDKRQRVIERYLASPESADAWVGYWQDVLAENPSVVFPTLNNSGAFRDWIYQAFRDNKPFDQFATELALLEEGTPQDPGPSGFGIATGNDAPMAMRALVFMKAFAAVDLTCARCHDSPVDSFQQADLFRIAAHLQGSPLQVPSTSLVAIEKATTPGTITSSLKAGQTIRPEKLSGHWLSDSPSVPTRQVVQPGNPRAQLAALLTSPLDPRFSDVIVNRVWKRCFGEALVEPLDNWNHDPPVPPALRFLSGEFVRSGYDLKALMRTLLTSESWQSLASQRRMSAEQLVDSLFVAVRKDFRGETLGVHATDPGAVQLPAPRRAWQFAALPNERDRPALGMPINQTFVDLMSVFDWNGSRQQSRSVRDESTSFQQSLLLHNGLLSQRVVRLSEESGITEIALQESSLDQFIDDLYLSFLTRFPIREERELCRDILDPVYADRRTGRSPRPVQPLSSFQPDWRRHLQPEETTRMLAAQRKVARGEPPTLRLTNDFRERVEDIVWALLNSPEFVIVP